MWTSIICLTGAGGCSETPVPWRTLPSAPAARCAASKLETFACSDESYSKSYIFAALFMAAQPARTGEGCGVKSDVGFPLSLSGRITPTLFSFVAFVQYLSKVLRIVRKTYYQLHASGYVSTPTVALCSS